MLTVRGGFQPRQSIGANCFVFAGPQSFGNELRIELLADKHENSLARLIGPPHHAAADLYQALYTLQDQTATVAGGIGKNTEHYSYSVLR